MLDYDDFQSVLTSYMNLKFIKLPAKSIVLKKTLKKSIISIPKSQQSLRLFEFNFFLPSHHSKKKLPY